MTEQQNPVDPANVSEDPVVPSRPRGVKTIEIDDDLMGDIRELVHSQASAILLNIVTDLHEADIAEIINRLDAGDREFVFNLLEPAVGSAVLLELNAEVRGPFMDAWSSEKISSYVDLLPSDDAADIVAELSPSVAEKVLRSMPAEDSSDVKELMQYRPDSAGGIMGTEFVSVRMNDTISKAISEVRAGAKNGMVIYAVYVVDDDGVLVGELPLQTLVLHSPNRRVYKIMEPDAQKISAEVDQEEVAAIFRKYDLIALPVVDTKGKLVGRISIDDIVDVIEEEHNEDVARMVGSDAEELERRSPAQIALLRLPWVLTTLFIEFLAGIVIHHFDQTLSKVILLASFMPIISAISGNTGLQSAAIIVRAMSTGHVTLDRWWAPLWRQVQTTLIIGAVCGLVIGLVGAIWQGVWIFGAVIGTSMFISVNISGVVGTTVPMISKRMGFDPALTAGPFETAFQDVVGISIFLSLATLLLQWMV